MGRIPSLRRQYLDLNLELIKAEIQRDELAKVVKALRERAEKAEAERDEARAQAVWAIHVNAPIGWVACAPGGGGEGLRLVDGAWVEQTMCISEGTRFSTEAEALAAGRALPWWEVPNA